MGFRTSNLTLSNVVRRSTVGAAIGLSLACVGLPASASAATPNFVVTPHTKSQLINTTYTVDVVLNATSPTDAVEATLTYNPDHLKFVSVNTTGTAFPVELPTRQTRNTVTITRGIFSPASVKSQALIAKVQFKILGKTGIAGVKLTGNAAYQGKYVNPTKDWATLYVHAK